MGVHPGHVGLEFSNLTPYWTIQFEANLLHCVSLKDQGYFDGRELRSDSVFSAAVEVPAETPNSVTIE